MESGKPGILNTGAVRRQQKQRRPAQLHNYTVIIFALT